MMNRDTRLMSEINVTPLVDVMLVLLVIFMITAPLMQHGIDIELPKESTSAVDVKQVPTITLKANKKIFWDKDGLGNLVDLTERLNDYRSRKPEGGVYFRAEQSLDY